MSSAHWLKHVPHCWIWSNSSRVKITSSFLKISWTRSNGTWPVSMADGRPTPIVKMVMIARSFRKSCGQLSGGCNRFSNRWHGAVLPYIRTSEPAFWISETKVCAPKVNAAFQNKLHRGEGRSPISSEASAIRGITGDGSHPCVQRRSS